jgi:hypothetical protein
LRHTQCRRKAEGQCRSNGSDNGERKHAPIECDTRCAHRFGNELSKKPHCRHSEGKSSNCAKSGKDQAFRQELGDQPSTSSAQSRAYRDFTSAHRASLQQQVKHPATAGSPIRIAAAGKLTVPALFAAAIDGGIQALYLSEGLVSFRDVVDSELYNHPFANFVLGLLNHTDLPEVAASIAPRHIVLAGPVNAKGETVDAEAARKIYAGSQQAGNLTIQSNSEWSAERLLTFVTQ